MTESAGTDTATFTLQRVQTMLSLSRTVISGLIAAGFVTPARGKRNEHRFTFQDLLLLRTAHALQAARIPPRKILRSLGQLKAALPAEMPLTGLRITAIGSDVTVRDRDGHRAADTGQLLLDFEIAPEAGSVVLLDAEPAASAKAKALFHQAIELEAGDATAAEAAYRRLLELEAAHTDAYLNLGALLSDAQRFAEVVDLSRRALSHGVVSAILHFNLAVALDSLGHVQEALDAYARSLELDPQLADAHFNIGRLHEQLGDERGALRHFNAFRRLQT